MPSGNFERYRRDWDVNAHVDPMWAVLSLPEKMGGRWDEHDFYATGEQEITEVFRFMYSHSIALCSTNESALDFGSGLGRLTEALGRRFSTAVGVDISKLMIDRATDRAAALKLSNIKYVLSASTDLGSLGVRSFDFISSNITLQHLNADLQKTYILEFANLLRPSGVVAFQIPSRPPDQNWRGLSAARRVRFLRLIALAARSLVRGILPWRIKMEFNTLPEADVNSFAKGAGLRPAAVGYIDWDGFYEDQVFRIRETPNEWSSYPVSPMYFFVRESGF